MSVAVDNLRAKVSRATTVQQSAIDLITTISTAMREVAGDQAATNQLADELDAKVSDLALAVTEHTPAAPGGPQA